MKIFAYGALMSLKHMNEHAIPFSSRVPAVLHGHELKFEKKDKVYPEIGWANISKKEGKQVHGVLYEIPDEGIAMIDIREEFPTGYTREPIEVMLQSGERVPAIAYIAHPNMVMEKLLPTVEYITLICESIDLLPAAYLESIRSVPSLNINPAYLRS